jgi:hypothetical protein
MVTSITHGRRVEVSTTRELEENKEMNAKKDFSEETNQVQTKVLDTDHNLVAIGIVMWENNVCYFQPSKVFS